MSDITLGSVDDIPIGEGRAYAVEGRQIAVFRRHDGSLRALDAVCPHRGGPLADGLTDANVVICPLHSYTYDLSTGAEVANGGVGVTAYRVHADETGTVHLDIDGAAQGTEPRHNGALSRMICHLSTTTDRST
ncbi:Rieske 2Fe-2S domain-containing protein [Mycobacterium sherrisii]|nr:Rieske 2Fe-2S domain-containing protein [Mycobacterium sherrisii]